MVTQKNVLNYIGQYNSTAKFIFSDALLADVVNNSPKHPNLSVTAMKVATINSIYTGGVRNKDVETLSRLIFNINSFDLRLAKGDLKLVDEIAYNGFTQNCYVFSTKYCHYHNPNAYPIFDSSVEKVFKKNFRSFSSMALSESRYSIHIKESYVNFFQEFFAFQIFYNLFHLKYKEIDKFLWLYGKTI